MGLALPKWLRGPFFYGYQSSLPTRTVEFRKATGSQVLDSWNKEVRATSGFCEVWEAAVAAVGNWEERA